jgi:hypothetical protein
MNNIHHDAIIEYDNGTYYKGCVLGQNTRHGFGYIYSNDTSSVIESGYWRNDIRHGPFMKVSTNLGTLFEGNYMHDLRHGHGFSVTKINNEIHTYTGEWSNDVEHGKGQLTIHTEDNNITYEGTWCNGLRHGPMNIYNKLSDTTIHTEWCNDVNITTFDDNSDDSSIHVEKSTSPNSKSYWTYVHSSNEIQKEHENGV